MRKRHYIIYIVIIIGCIISGPYLAQILNIDNYEMQQSIFKGIVLSKTIIGIFIEIILETIFFHLYLYIID